MITSLFITCSMVTIEMQDVYAEIFELSNLRRTMQIHLMLTYTKTIYQIEANIELYFMLQLKSVE